LARFILEQNGNSSSNKTERGRSVQEGTTTMVELIITDDLRNEYPNLFIPHATIQDIQVEATQTSKKNSRRFLTTLERNTP